VFKGPGKAAGDESGEQIAQFSGSGRVTIIAPFTLTITEDLETRYAKSWLQ
jgi:hypothetical protein